MTPPKMKEWRARDFADAEWASAAAPFGTPAFARTVWTNNDLWLRRGFDLSLLPSGQLVFRIQHDHEVEVYLNGIEVFDSGQPAWEYTLKVANDDAVSALKLGGNVLAVHCHKKAERQIIDLGIYTLPDLDGAAEALARD